MDAFDAVIGNEGRTPERVLYDASDWMLLLTGHERAFGASKALPVFPPAPVVSGRWPVVRPAQKPEPAVHHLEV